EGGHLIGERYTELLGRTHDRPPPRVGFNPTETSDQQHSKIRALREEHSPQTHPSKNRSTSPSSTLLSTNASPIPRARMNGTRPPLFFLSCSICWVSRLPSAVTPISARLVRKPASARCLRTRSASAGVHSPRAAEKSNASAMPAATASPCSSRSEKPVSASSAWPKVWPRLSRARLPLVSRSFVISQSSFSRVSKSLP